MFDNLLLESLSLAVRTISSQKVHIVTNASHRRTTSLIHAYFSVLLDNPYCISINRRVPSLLKLLNIIEDMLKYPFHDLLLISSSISQLCVQRLRNGPDKVWCKVDARLQRLLKGYPSELPLGISFIHLEVCLNEQPCDNEPGTLCVSEYDY